jgi:hypothetical protein
MWDWLHNPATLHQGENIQYPIAISSGISYGYKSQASQFSIIRNKYKIKVQLYNMYIADIKL